MTFREYTFTQASEEEGLLIDRPIEEVLRRAAAIAHVEAEEAVAADSKRPTLPVFQGEPWL